MNKFVNNFATKLSCRAENFLSSLVGNIHANILGPRIASVKNFVEYISE
jgi:hypothetical protein